MSTRRLIITALVCGMAILLAGGVFLVRVANSRTERTLTVHQVGEPVRVGDLTVTVTDADVGEARVQVAVSVDATGATLAFPTDAEAPWTLLIRTPRPRTDPAGDVPACRGRQITGGAQLACALAFEAAEGPAFLAFDWRGATVRWRLA